jgi:hypothetical protein
MYTSAECRKRAEAKIKCAERERDERRANSLSSAANAWLILAHGIKTFELNRKFKRSFAVK